MMLKNLSRLEHAIGDKIYHFTCDMDSSLEHVKEAMFQMIKFVGQIEDSAKAQAAAADKKQEPTSESPVTEVVEMPKE